MSPALLLIIALAASGEAAARKEEDIAVQEEVLGNAAKIGSSGHYSSLDTAHVGQPGALGPTDRKVEEISSRAGRRLKKLRRVALPLLLGVLLVKAGLGMPLLMGGVALAAFKGLWTGSTALLVTAALALRHVLPAPRVVIAPGGGHGHHHYTDYIADYSRRADDYRDDYNRYTPPSYGWKK